MARNRITDLFRKKKPESWSETALVDEDDELLRLEDLLPSPEAGPEALYARNALLAELEPAAREDEDRSCRTIREGLAFSLHRLVRPILSCGSQRLCQ